VAVHAVVSAGDTCGRIILMLDMISFGPTILKRGPFLLMSAPVLRHCPKILEV